MHTHTHTLSEPCNLCVSGLKVLPNPQQLGALDAALAQGGAPKGMVGKLMGMLGKKSKAMGQGGLDAAGTAAGAMGAMGGDMVGEAMSAMSAVGDASGLVTPMAPEEEEEGPDGEPDPNASRAPPDDLVSPMMVETYVDFRVRPYVDYLERRAPVIANRYRALELGGMLSNTTGAVLAVMGMADFIPITVATAALCMAVGDYFYVPAQLAASNSAMQDTQNLLNWYDGLSLVQLKTRQSKLKACMTMEGAALSLIAARTAMSPALPGDASAEEEEEE